MNNEIIYMENFSTTAKDLPTIGSGLRVRGTSSSGCLNATVESSTLLCRPIKLTESS